MSGCLKPYFHFVLWCGVVLDSLQQAVEPIHCIGDSEHIHQDFPLRTENEAIMLKPCTLDEKAKTIIRREGAAYAARLIVELHGPLRNGAEKKGSYGGVSPGWNTARNFVMTPQQYLKPSSMRLYSKLSGCYNWIRRMPRRR